MQTQLEKEGQERKARARGGQYHDRPDIAGDRTPDLRPEGSIARRDPEAKKLRDERLAVLDGLLGKNKEKLDKMETKHKQYDQDKKARTQKEQEKEERGRERER